MMARNPGCHHPAAVMVLVILLFIPVKCLCREDTCCGGKDVELKRYDDFDYDRFVSLMGRRSAAQSDEHGVKPETRRRHMDHILAHVLWGRTRKPLLKEDQGFYGDDLIALTGAD